MKDYYKQEDFNWDNVNENEWEKWEEEEKEMISPPVLWELKSLEILDHHFNSPEHISSFLKERINWL